MADRKHEVDELRQEIAKVDAHLLAALNKRARAASRLGELRKDRAPALPLADHAALRALLEQSTGEMPEEAVRAVFREVFAACLPLELRAKATYLEPEGGAIHAAALGRFGGGSLTAAESTPAALEEVLQKRAEFAVVPLETVAEGILKATLTSLLPGDLRIVEVLVAVQAGAADSSGPRARYAVVGTRPSGRTGQDATSLVFSVHETPGALLDVLKVFVERGLPLTNIQSHVVEAAPKGHLFYVEIDGHFTDRPLAVAFEELKRITRFFKILGSYPAP